MTITGDRLVGYGQMRRCSTVYEEFARRAGAAISAWPSTREPYNWLSGGEIASVTGRHHDYRCPNRV